MIHTPRASRALAPVLVTVLLAAPPLGAQSAPATSGSAVERARAGARALAERLGLPGLSVAVATDGRLAWAEGFGHADLENDVPVTRETKFRIGSLSKLLTVAAVACLVQAGKLDLDAPIQTYVDDFPPKKSDLSVRQLLSHTAGIRHYGPDDGLETPRYFESVREGLKIFAKDPLLFEPGTQYRYSSYGYNLASAAVEGASGTDFLRYLERAVIEPLALTATAADDRPRIVPHRTRFYHVKENGDVVNAPCVDNSYKWASGGMLSSAEDLVRLGLAFLEPGFFEAATLEKIFTPQENAGTERFRVGLGWRISEDERGPRYHHGGAIAGGRAYILMYPGSKTVVVILANTFARFGLEEAQQFAAVFLGEGG